MSGPSTVVRPPCLAFSRISEMLVKKPVGPCFSREKSVGYPDEQFDFATILHS
jgi:hypothetical protein